MIDNGPIYNGPRRKRMKDNRLKDIARKLQGQKLAPRNYGGITPPRAEGGFTPRRGLPDVGAFADRMRAEEQRSNAGALPPPRNLNGPPKRRGFAIPEGKGALGVNTYTGNSRSGQAFRTGWKDGQKVHVYADGSRVKVGPRRKKGGPTGGIRPA